MIRLWSIPPRWKIPVRFFGNKASEGRLGKITLFCRASLENSFDLKTWLVTTLRIIKKIETAYQKLKR